MLAFYKSKSMINLGLLNMTSGTREKINTDTASSHEDDVDPYAVDTILDGFKESGKNFMNVYCLVAGYVLNATVMPVKEISCDIVNNRARPAYDLAADIFAKRGVEGVFKLPEDDNPKI